MFVDRRFSVNVTDPAESLFRHFRWVCMYIASEAEKLQILSFVSLCGLVFLVF